MKWRQDTFVCFLDIKNKYRQSINWKDELAHKPYVKEMIIRKAVEEIELNSCI